MLKIFPTCILESFWTKEISTFQTLIIFETLYYFDLVSPHNVAFHLKTFALTQKSID
jgi:hypothetical protein